MANPTLDELHAALINADKAGDAAAARMLAAEIQKTPAAPRPPVDTRPTWMERTVAPFLEQKFAQFGLDKIPARGIVQGAADAPIGAAQLVANIAQQGDGINKFVKDKEAEYQSTRGGDSSFDWARLGGNIIGPANLLAAGPAAVTTAGRIGQGMKVGGLSGAVNPLENFSWGDKAEQVGISTALGGLIPAGWEVAKAGGKLMRNLVDPALPGGLERAVGRLGNVNAGDKRDEVVNALLSAKQGQTSGQAAVSAGSPEFAAMQEMAKRSKPAPYLARGAQQEAERVAELGTVGQTKQALETAVNVRGQNAAQNYGAAFQNAVKADPALLQLSENPYFQKALPTALDLAKAKGINPKTDTTEFLHMVKIGIDKQLGATGDTALANAEKAAAQDAKSQLVGWLKTKNPDYEIARSTFAADSKPINQMEIGQYLGDKLTPPLGSTERAASFAQAVRDAPGTIKRSTGQSMYDDLGQVLEPNQVQSVNKVLDALKNEAAYKKMAEQGMTAASKNIGVTMPDVPATGAFNPKLSVARALVNRVVGKEHGKVLETAGEVMLDPQRMAEAMKKATPFERQKIVDELMKLQAAGLGQQP